MSQNQELINKLIEKLELLFSKQAEFSSEIKTLKEELYRLKSGDVEDRLPETEAIPIKIEKPTPPPIHEVVEKIEPVVSEVKSVETPKPQTETFAKPKPIAETPKLEARPIQPKSKSSLEKFIGENILNKIGIVITIIGVAIGAKYSIENNLISPLTRIILGYFTAIGLLGFGIKLKNKYESYSAVLVSGAIVILYFITFFAHSFYDLIPQIPTFALMVIFTAFTVVAAISYNRQVIAHIGLVGAYAIPFLLSDGSGRVEVMFTYMAIVNVGILIISFKKYWKSIYYSAFICTWLIYMFWFFFDYKESSYYSLALLFLGVFFIIFYVTFVAYKTVKKEAFNAGDLILLLLNSFIFYGLGIAILNTNETGEQLLGVFTLCNAVVHFIVSVIFYKMKLGDKKLFYLASAMVLVFITITIPVQLDGNWVTLLWISEAALLFWLGRDKNIPIYEKLSYPLVFLAFLSLLQDWLWAYNSNSYTNTVTDRTTLFNIDFLSSFLFLLGISFIVWFDRKTRYTSALKLSGFWQQILNFVLPTVLIISAYYAFRLEIEMYWNQLFQGTRIELKSSNTYNSNAYNYALKDFKTVWIINYSLVFLSILSFVNFKFIKNKLFEKIVLGFIVVFVLVFLMQGLYAMSELRDTYLEPSEYFAVNSFYLLIRYVSFVFLALVLYICYRFIKGDKISKGYKIAYDILLHVTILWVLSSELLHWMDIFDSKSSYKLGLSILWGLYSFSLIAFGIWKSKVYLRIGGMILFGITLIKLFFYDISHLNTISKTIVFVSLGILLLVISFLYNKFKNQISDEIDN